MTYAKFIELRACMNALPKSVVRGLLSDAFRNIAELTKRSGRFSVPGFGVFHVKTRKARRIRDIATGELRQLPAVTTLGFRAAKAVKS